jgi:hypothetical protein
MKRGVRKEEAFLRRIYCIQAHEVLGVYSPTTPQHHSPQSNINFHLWPRNTLLASNITDCLRGYLAFEVLLLRRHWSRVYCSVICCLPRRMLKKQKSEMSIRKQVQKGTKENESNI